MSVPQMCTSLSSFFILFEFTLPIFLVFSTRQRGAALSVKSIYYVASLILHERIAEITAQLLSLSYVYQTMVRLSGFLFRLTSWKGELVISQWVAFQSLFHIH